MGRLQVGIGFVLGVTPAIVGQTEDLVRRIVRPFGGDGRVHAVGARPAVLIDVVAHVQDEVEARQVGQRLVGVEIALWIERAGGHRDHRVPGGAGRQGARAAQRRGHAPGLEREGVGLARVQARHIHLGSVVAVRSGHPGSAFRAAGPTAHRVQRPAIGDLTAGLLRGKPRPQHHPILQRIPRGDPVPEADPPAGRLRGGRRGRAETDQAKCCASVDFHSQRSPVCVRLYDRAIPQEYDSPCPAKPCTSPAKNRSTRR